jgi:hypothetical protein
VRQDCREDEEHLVQAGLLDCGAIRINGRCCLICPRLIVVIILFRGVVLRHERRVPFHLLLSKSQRCLVFLELAESIAGYAKSKGKPIFYRLLTPFAKLGIERLSGVLRIPR